MTPTGFEQTHLVLLRTINASATTLDPALLHRLPGSLPGPWGTRWHQAALAAVVITAHKMNLPAGRAPGQPDPLKTDVPFHTQLPLLMEAYAEYGAAGVRHLLAPVDAYRAQALTLGQIVISVKLRRRWDDAYQEWSGAVMDYATSLHPPIWLVALRPVISIIAGLGWWLWSWGTLFLPAVAVFLLLSGSTVSRLMWSACALLLTFVLGNLIHLVRKRAAA